MLSDSLPLPLLLDRLLLGFFPVTFALGAGLAIAFNRTTGEETGLAEEEEDDDDDDVVSGLDDVVTGLIDVVVAGLIEVGTAAAVVTGVLVVMGLLLVVDTTTLLLLVDPVEPGALPATASTNVSQPGPKDS
jgi:hypothetical protein